MSYLYMKCNYTIFSLLALSSCAREFNYVRPTFTEESVIEVVGGRYGGIYT